MIGGNEFGQKTDLNDRMIAFINKGGFNKKIEEIFTSRSIPENKSLLDQARDFFFYELGHAVMGEFHDELLGKPGLDVYIEGREELVQPAVNWFMNELIKHKDYFQYIFRTSRGSTYFVLPTGESMRFRVADPDIRQGLFGPIRREEPLRESYTTIEQVIEKCYFIDNQELEKISSANRNSGMIDIDVQTSELRIGAIPLEVKSAYKHGVGNMPINPDTHGVLHIGQNVFSYHSGTPVTKIIKK